MRVCHEASLALENWHNVVLGDEHHSPLTHLPRKSTPVIDFDIFMPGELTPAEYYHSYLSSQRRVERWVVETEKELTLLAIDARVHPQDRASLKEKKLEAEKEAAMALPTPAPTHVAPTVERQRSREVRADSKEQHPAHEADVRTSGRHRSVGASSKKRSRSRLVDSRSRSRPSSGSKKRRTITGAVDDAVPEARSRPIDARKSSAHTHRRHRQQQASSSLSTYLLYGVLPMIYAMTGSSALLLLITVILCAGYLYHMETPSKTKLDA